MIPSMKHIVKKNCIEICINREVENKYNCVIPSYYYNNDFSYCGDIYSLGYEKLFDYYHLLKIEFENECVLECPKECKSTRFSTSLISESVAKKQNYFYIWV